MMLIYARKLNAWLTKTNAVVNAARTTMKECRAPQNLTTDIPVTSSTVKTGRMCISSWYDLRCCFALKV